MNYPNRVIKKGEQEKALVKQIQKELVKRGITDLKIDGDFGANTASAVMLFQSLNRDYANRPLVVDGAIGRFTWDSLFGIVPDISAVPPSQLFKETLSVAESQVGVMENPEGSNRGIEVDRFNKAVGVPFGSYWCAAFVYFCFREAAKNIGIESPVHKTGGCLDHWNKTSGKKIFALKAKEDPSLIKPGFIFILDHGHNKGHTGIVKRTEGGRLITIEGNSNPNGSRNGIGVFEIDFRSVWSPNLKGFIDYS